MNVWSADEPDDAPAGLAAFISTNVMAARPLTAREIDNFHESVLPTMWSHQFEVGPEVMFA